MLVHLLGDEFVTDTDFPVNGRYHCKELPLNFRFTSEGLEKLESKLWFFIKYL